MPRRSKHKDASSQAQKHTSGSGEGKSRGKTNRIVLPALAWHRPIIKGEDPKQYDVLLKAMMDAISPRDAPEMLLTFDLTRYSWEIMRASRMRAERIQEFQAEAAAQGIADAITALSENKLRAAGRSDQQARYDQLKELRDALGKIAVGDEDAANASEVADAYKRGAAAGASPRAYLAALQELEILDRMILIWEQRRDQIIREIERRRDAQSERITRAAYEGLRALDLRDQFEKAKGASDQRRAEAFNEPPETADPTVQ